MSEIFPRGVSAPAQRALASVGVQCLEDLRNHSEAELAKLHGMGPKALRILKETLAERGWAFGDRA